MIADRADAPPPVTSLVCTLDRTLVCVAGEPRRSGGRSYVGDPRPGRAAITSKSKWLVCVEDRDVAVLCDGRRAPRDLGPLV